MAATAVALAAAPVASAGKPHAFVPDALLSAASAHPDAVFDVIVQGEGGRSSDVAAAVRAEHAARPGHEKGLKRQFRSVDGVSAQLTGAQIVKLASKKGILALTTDTRLRPTDLSAPGLPPMNTLPPVLSGTAEEGQALTVWSGDWSGSGTLSYGYQWQRCDAAIVCTDIAAADQPTYYPVAADVGSTLQVVVTASNDLGSAAATTAPSDPVVPAPLAPHADAAPALSGTPQDGQTLSATSGQWSGTGPFGYAYRWQRCDSTGACTDVDGAVADTYAVTTDDVGSTLRVVVTATTAIGTAEAASDVTATVSAAPAPEPPPVEPAPPPAGYSSQQQWPYASGVASLWPPAPGARPQPPTIAVIDSGIDDTRADFGGRVVRQLVMTSLRPNSFGDGRGHGTFIAGIAAGEAPDYAGVAPRAKLVSLDVMNDDGMAMTSDVIAAVDWILENKDHYGIRVANLSLQGSVPASVGWDPLDRAVEQLWLAGVVVVAAAGNYGTGDAASGVTYAPGNDPFVITVGADDLNGTTPPADDATAPWSAWGYTLDGFAKPELGAPGRYIVGPVPPASTLALSQPDSVVAPGYMQLSGTSISAAIVSGTASLLLAAHPDWTPDQVKGALMLAAQPTASADFSGGVGELDAARAAALGDAPNPNLALEAFLVASTDGLLAFDPNAWAAKASADASWNSASWNSASWNSASWNSASWNSASWNSASWNSASWNSASWNSASWNSASWNSASWNSVSGGSSGAPAEPTDAVAPGDAAGDYGLTGGANETAP